MKIKRKILVAPSILSANFAELGKDIQDVEKKGADLIHVDVMDGSFVPNLTIGSSVVKGIRDYTRLPLDVHLMIDEPIRYVGDFYKAGSDWITIHTEATKKVRQTLLKIRKLGAKAGISLKPGSSLNTIKPYLKLVDLVLIMTVEPGFGGQSFMPDQLGKIRELRRIFKGLICVDGGINAETGALCVKAGADLLVAGSYIFGSKDRKRAIASLKKL